VGVGVGIGVGVRVGVGVKVGVGVTWAIRVWSFASSSGARHPADAAPRSRITARNRSAHDMC
jgi:hypothetical protein